MLATHREGGRTKGLRDEGVFPSIQQRQGLAVLFYLLCRELFGSPQNSFIEGP